MSTTRMATYDGRIAQNDCVAAIHGDLIGRHDVEAEKVEVFEDASAEYGVCLRTGWTARVIADKMLRSDARAVAKALALVLNCPVTIEGEL